MFGELFFRINNCNVFKELFFRMIVVFGIDGVVDGVVIGGIVFLMYRCNGFIKIKNKIKDNIDVIKNVNCYEILKYRLMLNKINIFGMFVLFMKICLCLKCFSFGVVGNGCFGIWWLMWFFVGLCVYWF